MILRRLVHHALEVRGELRAGIVFGPDRQLRCRDPRGTTTLELEREVPMARAHVEHGFAGEGIGNAVQRQQRFEIVDAGGFHAAQIDCVVPLERAGPSPDLFSR